MITHHRIPFQDAAKCCVRRVPQSAGMSRSSLAKLGNLSKDSAQRRPFWELFFIDYRCCRSTRDALMRALNSDPIVQHSLTIPKRRLRSGVIGKPVRTIERSDLMPRRTIRSTRFKHRYQRCASFVERNVNSRACRSSPNVRRWWNRRLFIESVRTRHTVVVYCHSKGLLSSL